MFMPAYRNVRRYNRNSPGGGAVRNLARGMGYAWRNRRSIVKAGRAFGKSIRSKFASRNELVTQQRDVRTSRPPRTKPVNKRFRRRVESVISQHAGKNTVLFNGPTLAVSAPAGTQNFTMFTLFGSNGASGMNSDLVKILTFHEDAADLETAESKNLFFEYGVLQIGFTNRNPAPQPIIVEIYEYRTRRGISIYTSPVALVNAMVADEPVLIDPLGGASQIQMEQVGVTPYQIPSLCKNLKFGKKTTMQVQGGQTATYTMARKKKRWLTGQKVADSGTFAFDGWTEGLLFVFKGCPANGTSAIASNVDFMFNRKYCWRAMDPDAKNEYLRSAW